MAHLHILPQHRLLHRAKWLPRPRRLRLQAGIILVRIPRLAHVGHADRRLDCREPSLELLDDCCRPLRAVQIMSLCRIREKLIQAWRPTTRLRGLIVGDQCIVRLWLTLGDSIRLRGRRGAPVEAGVCGKCSARSQIDGSGAREGSSSRRVFFKVPCRDGNWYQTEGLAVAKVVSTHTSRSICRPAWR